MKQSSGAQSGVTLVELIITIVIISIALAGTIIAFSSVVGRSSDTLFQSRAIALGQAYLDEIMSQPFDLATPAGGVPPYLGACRVVEDSASVDQYHGDIFSPPQLASGSIDSDGYDGFRVSISISCVGNPADELGVPATAMVQAKRIDVTITGPTSQTAIFSAYRTNF